MNREELRAAYEAGAADLLGHYEGIGASDEDATALFEAWLSRAHPALARFEDEPPNAR